MSRYFMLLCSFLVFAAPAPAAEQSVQDFLHSIYVHYEGKADTAKGINLDKPADYRRYFEPSLASLMIADAQTAAKHGDAPELDSDPFIDAQDWDITNLAIHVDAQDSAKASATVKFQNFKDMITIHLVLVHAPSGWRIADIVWNGNDGTLRRLYVKK